MAQTHSSWRVIAVISSIFLVGGFVCHQAGDGLLPSTKSGRVTPRAGNSDTATVPDSASPATAPAAASLSDEFKVMAGTKAGVPIVENPADEATEPTTRPKRKLLFHGSKSPAIDAGGQQVLYGDEIPGPASTQPMNKPASEP